jgi:DMSO/TMAO reductase YedYZ molybdopterin-dependent catalytic subunit
MNDASGPSTRAAAILGVALGIAFAICAATGLWSHLHQHEPSWLALPARPAGLYRITQGLHVVTGFAVIPLLVAKLAVVHHKLFEWPPVRDLRHAIERACLLPLVAGATFLLFSGVANVARWYPWGFFFPAAHEAAAWLTGGALLVHIGARWRATREGLGVTARPLDGDRRALVLGAGATSALLAVGVAGSTVSWLSPLSFLAQRRPGTGPQGLPVNKTARSAGVTEAAIDPAWRLEVAGAVARPLSLSLDELRAMPQTTAELPIACVEGWSASARWTGVAVRDLLARAGAASDAEVRAVSLQQRGLYRQSALNRHQAGDRDTLVALLLDGEPLHLEHGFPARLIGPGRPGVEQTKWLARLEVV